MTYIRGSFILDSLAVNTATPAVTTVQVALGVVPLTWLRKDSGVQHASTDHATFFSGVDYYAMMTGMPGTKNLLLTADGSSGLQTFNFKVDPSSMSDSISVGTRKSPMLRQAPISRISRLGLLIQVLLWLTNKCFLLPIGGRKPAIQTTGISVHLSRVTSTSRTAIRCLLLSTSTTSTRVLPLSSLITDN